MAIERCQLTLPSGRQINILVTVGLSVPAQPVSEWQHHDRHRHHHHPHVACEIEAETSLYPVVCAGNGLSSGQDGRRAEGPGAVAMNFRGRLLPAWPI